MKKSRWVPWAAASSALLLTAALSACSSGGKEPADDSSSGAPSASASTDGAGGKTTLTVSVFTEDRFLKSAVEQFEQAHPEIDVQIQEAVPTDLSDGQKAQTKIGPDDGPSAEDKDKYINSVNTALMSGNAADLISVSYLPIDRYLDKGMFADWTELAGNDADFQAADYYEKVLKGMSDGKGWYAIPIHFTFNAVIGNKAVLDQVGGVDDKTWTWEQFVALCRQIAATTNADGTKPQALGGYTPEDVLGYLVKTTYAELVTRQGSEAKFDEAAFRGYLEQVKQLYDSGAAGSNNLGRQQQVFSPLSLKSPMELATLPNAVGNGEGEVLQPPGTGQDEGFPFTSDLAFALNDRSKVKTAAWEFVKFLLSEPIQADPGMTGFPVHQAATKKKLEEFAEKLQSGDAKMMIQNKGGGPAQAVTISDEQIEAVLALLPSVGKYERTDDKVIEMIKEEAAPFFSGGKTADAVAKAVRSRVNTYLNE